MKTIRKRYAGIIRAATVGVSVILQVVFLYLMAVLLKEYSSWFYILLEIVSVLVVFSMLDEGETYKNSWIIIILLLPVFGFCLYFMWGRNRRNSRTYKRVREVYEKSRHFRKQDKKIIEKFKEEHPNKALISQRLINEGFMLYDNTKVTYYDVGEKKFEALYEDLKRAQKFIFLEYFIVNDGEVWSRIKDILARKVKEHVEVRFLYDDFGCLNINTPEFREELAVLGIRFSVFSPIHKEATRLTFNYRNHQKIAIIDGNVGYTGGINLSDEYANIIERFGHWKDTAVRLEGSGVWGLTTIFLEMWEISKGYENLDYSRYMPTVQIEAKGFVQPLADGPANNPNNPIWDTYMHMIDKARDYIYFTTPYLVLDREMVNDLCRAAKSGVDVRIITPRKYDKWYVYMVTVKNYGVLLQNGVKIYEYVPGFIHSKTVVSDDECAICGSINMDYRSFYLHYEGGVFMSDTEAVTDIKEDILNTLKVCEEITIDKWKKRPFRQKMIQYILRIFSPML